MVDRHGIWHYEDETERRKWQNPEAILKEIGLKPGQTFMDIGCGAGFFTLPAARMVGKRGKVYGLDSQDSAIAEVRKRAADEGLANLELKVGKAEENLLCQGCADFIFFGIVLHDFEDQERVLAQARLMIKPAGKLVDLDWKKIKMSIGPPFARRFDETKASSLIEKAGFNVESVKDSGERHYLIIGRPA